MSKVVDERIVSMQFDNSKFEKNVQTSMNTLSKLKQSLNFKGASSGLENISVAAKKVDMSGVSKGVETVQMKFKALEVVGVTALANITNSAINTGKRMISSLTIDPIKTGFQEYETQINAVQTILANTQNKGTTLDQVNAALDTLNTYADKTIYNFTEMTRNIGTFTAAGVDLETSVNAIQGIANLAAVSGSTSQQASTAMYQLSQALSTGTVKLMDWNSVVNAGMGGQVFQDALKETSRLLGTGADAAIQAQGSFRESLQTGWLTSQVLTETLKKFTTSGANEYIAKYCELSEEEVAATYNNAKAQYGEAEAIDHAAQALADKSGKNKDEIKSALEMAKNAEDAATKVKTWTQLWDTLKEAAQSGWTQSWELILGDFEEAKTLFTEISDKFNGIISKSAEARNSLLKGALSNKWKDFTEEVNKAGVSTEDFTEKLKEIANTKYEIKIDELIQEHGSLANVISKGLIPAQAFTDTLKSFTSAGDEASETTKAMNGNLEYFQKVVSEVWNGDWKNGTERVEALTKAGYDYNKVQDLVNKTIDGHKLTLEEVSDEQLKAIGCTEEQVTTLRELADQAEKTGTPLNKLIEEMGRSTGRELLIDSFRNALGGLWQMIKSVSGAWKDIFPSMESEQLYGIIEGIHTLSERFRNFVGDADKAGSTAGKLRDTFKGLFSIVHILATIVGGVLKVAFNLFTPILGKTTGGILDVTAAVGRVLTAFDKWVTGGHMVEDAIDGIVSSAKKLWDAFLNLTGLGKVIDNFKNSFTGFDDIGKNIIDGLEKGLKAGAGRIPQAMIELGLKILEAIKGVLGIHSPSTEMHEVGTNVIEGLVNGIKDKAGAVLDAMAGIGEKIKGFLDKIDWGKVFAVGLTGVMLVFLKKMTDILDKFASPFAGVGKITSGIGKLISATADTMIAAEKEIRKVIKSFSKIFKGFGKVLNAFAFSIKAKAIKDIAISLGILVGAIVVLTMLDQGKMLNAIVAIGILAGILAALAIVANTLVQSKPTVEEAAKTTLSGAGMAAMLIGLGICMVLMAKTVEILGTMDMAEAKQGFIGLAGVVVAIGLVLLAFGQLVKGKPAQNIDKLGKMLVKMSIAMLLLVGVVKLVGMLTVDEMRKGLAFTAAFTVFVLALTGISRLAGRHMDKLGGTLIKMSIAMLILVGVVKLVGSLSEAEIKKGKKALETFVGVIAALTVIATFGKGALDNLGKTLLAMSISIGIMVIVVKMIAGIDPIALLKGLAGITAFGAVLVAFMVAMKILDGANIPKIAANLIAMSLAIGILAGIAIIMGLIDIEGLKKGVAAVGILGVVMALMIAATKNANDCKGNLIAMSVAIGVMAASVAVLSFIDPRKLAGATAAMGILMGMFSLMAFTAGLSKNVTKSLAVMVVAVGMLAGVLYLLSGLPAEDTLGAATSLSVLLVAMSASLLLISGIGIEATKALVPLLAMTAIVGLLAVIIGALSQFTDAEKAIGIAVSLSTLLLAMSAACLILTAVGTFAGQALAGIGILAVLVVAMGGLMVAIGALASHYPQMEEFLSKGIVLLNQIGSGIGTFLGNIVGGFMEGATDHLSEVGDNLSEFMDSIQPFMDGANNISGDAVTGIKNLAMAILAITAADVLSAISSFITGGNSMSEFGKQLSSLGEALTAYSDSISGLDASSIVKIQMSAEAAKALAKMAQEIPNEGGLVEKFTGNNSLTGLARQLKPFGEALADYANAISGETFNVEAIKNSAEAGKAIAEMAQEMPNAGGLVDKFTGDNSLTGVARQLKPFGEALAEYSNAVSGETFNVEAIKNSAKAAKAIADMAEDMPNSGGLAKMFAGDNGLDTIGKQLKPFGTALAEYSASVVGIDAPAISSSGTAIKDLITALNELPTMDGSKITSFTGALQSLGEVSVTGFVSAFTEAGTQISSAISLMISTALSSIMTKQSMFTSAGQTLMTGLQNGITMGIVNITPAISNVISMAAIAIYDKAPTFNIAGMLLMFNLSQGINAGIVQINPAIEAAIASAAIAVYNKAPTFNIAGMLLMLNVSQGIIAGGFMVVASVTVFLSSAVAALLSRQGMFQAAGVALMTGLRVGFMSGSTPILPYLTLMMARCLTAITSKRNAFMQAGMSLMQGLTSGLKAGSSGVLITISSSLSGCSSAIRAYYGSFYQAGTYLGQGLTSGIRAQQSAAYNAGLALGKAAVQGEKDGQQSRSPSKATQKAGKWLGQGLVIGMEQMGKAVYSSGKSMGENAVDSISGALSNISEVDGNSLAIAPTITPVLDMSNLASDNMQLSTNVTALLMKPVDSLTRIVTDAQASIDASNQEVIGAINRLIKTTEDDNRTYVFESHLDLDGKQIAKSAAPYTKEMMNKITRNNLRKGGTV